MKQTLRPFDPRQEMLRSDFEIFHSRDTALEAVDLHHHDFYEIYLFLSGQVEYRVEGAVYQLNPGDLLLISPLELHQVVVRSRDTLYERMVLWVGRQYLDHLQQGGEELSRCFDRGIPGHTNLLRPRDGGEIQELMEQILREREDGLYGSEWYCQGCLLQLLVLLNRLSMGDTGEAGEHSPLVSRVVEYIHDHCQEELRLDTLAKRFHVSKYYLSHQFSQAMGTSVYRYIMLKRLQLAREQILGGTPPGKAALACGFQDYPNFYRSFVKRYGVSPKNLNCRI